ncbi:TOPRIM nucleotidyl transferase/hydrolase domain-containing protein [Duncaniella muris]|uniref:TOPRIM nucleotidyl transferase/hydrolase domain-containing protein n=1 Tax=Duncaniella muris TaxID=2094150 RepID=UPI00351CBC6F
MGYSEIVFADKAILYEGDTERLLIKKLLTEERYEKLSQQYADGLERQKILSVVCAEHCFADAVH